MDGQDIVLHSYDAKQDTVCKLEKRKGKGAAIKPIINQSSSCSLKDSTLRSAQYYVTESDDGSSWITLEK